MSIQETPSFTCDGCTHDEILAKWISRFPDGSMVPVLVLFKNQLTPEELKGHMTINSTGRFDIKGEEDLIKSYGGNITRTFAYTNAIAANLPEDKLNALKNDPRVVSVDIDYPSCVIEQDCPPINPTQSSLPIGTKTDNLTKNTNANTNLSVNDTLDIHP